MSRSQIRVPTAFVWSRAKRPPAFAGSSPASCSPGTGFEETLRPMTAPWRTAWITGASSGIGRAVAVALAQRGVKVAASARSGDKLAEIARHYPGIAPLPLDVTAAVAMADASRSITSTLGPIDLAVFSAGIWEAMSARNFSATKAAHSMAVNYQGIVNGIEAVLPTMLARGEGHIALVAS